MMQKYKQDNIILNKIYSSKETQSPPFNDAYGDAELVLNNKGGTATIIDLPVSSGNVMADIIKKRFDGEHADRELRAVPYLKRGADGRTYIYSGKDNRQLAPWDYKDVNLMANNTAKTDTEVLKNVPQQPQGGTKKKVYKGVDKNGKPIYE